MSFINIKGMREIAKLSTAAKTVRRELNNLEKAFVKWNKDEEGGLLTYKIARKISQEIKDGLWSQEAFGQFRPAKDPEWEKILTYWGAKRPGDIGLGLTYSLYNAIDFVTAGKGGYAVGISRNKSMPTEVTVSTERGGTRNVRYGKISDLQRIAEILEFGYGNQPPRPFILPTFWKYVEDKLPDDIRNTILRDIIRCLRKSGAAVNAANNIPDYQPEEVFTAYVNAMESPAGVKAGTRMGEVLGTGEEQEGIFPAMDTDPLGELIPRSKEVTSVTYWDSKTGKLISEKLTEALKRKWDKMTDSYK